jgi:hypothetical protein
MTKNYYMTSVRILFGAWYFPASICSPLFKMLSDETSEFSNPSNYSIEIFHRIRKITVCIVVAEVLQAAILLLLFPPTLRKAVEHDRNEDHLTTSGLG